MIPWPRLLEIVKTGWFMLRAVIFDYNGTLLDDLSVAYGSVVEIFRVYNIRPPTLDQYRQEITADFIKFYYRHGFSDQPGNPLYANAADLNVIRKAYYKQHGHLADFRPDAEGVFQELVSRNIRLAIVSAEISSVLLERLEFTGLAKYFNGNMKGSVWGDKAPALFETAQRLGVVCEDTAYVDDSLDGTGAAKRLGMTAIGMGSGYCSPERLLLVTPYVINALTELLRFTEIEPLGAS